MQTIKVHKLMWLATNIWEKTFEENNYKCFRRIKYFNYNRGYEFWRLACAGYDLPCGPICSQRYDEANGFVDYLTMLNERDGGIGGVKIKVEECETGYKAEKGVECCESYRGKNPWFIHQTLQG